MGRRRRKKIKRVRRTRKLTSIRYFECPICGQPTLTIDFEKLKDKPGFKKAIVKCGSCGLYLELEVPELYERIDVYNKVVDMAYEGKLEETRRGSEEAEETSEELAEVLADALAEEAGDDDGKGAEGSPREEEEY